MVEWEWQDGLLPGLVNIGRSEIYSVSAPGTQQLILESSISHMWSYPLFCVVRMYGELKYNEVEH